MTAPRRACPGLLPGGPIALLGDMRLQTSPSLQHNIKAGTPRSQVGRQHTQMPSHPLRLARAINGGLARAIRASTLRRLISTKVPWTRKEGSAVATATSLRRSMKQRGCLSVAWCTPMAATGLVQVVLFHILARSQLLPPTESVLRFNKSCNTTRFITHTPSLHDARTTATAAPGKGTYAAACTSAAAVVVGRFGAAAPRNCAHRQQPAFDADAQGAWLYHAP